MINIIFIENKDQLKPEQIRLMENLVGEFEKNKAFRYRRWQDKQAFLLGKLLVCKLLKDQEYSHKLLKKMQYTNFNRPFIKEIKGDFNISHSGNYVLGAFSAGPAVGVDIEQIHPVNLSDFSYILNEMDNRKISDSDDKFLPFFKIWSSKEAILKAHGCGLVDDLFKLEVDETRGFFDNTNYYLQELKIEDGYSSFIASASPLIDVNIKKVTVEDCLESLL